MKSSYLHFKLNRIMAYLTFWFRLPYHIIFHSFDENTDGYRGYSIKGFIICDCGYVEDLGMTYGMHCELCYNRVTERYQQKQDSVM